MKEDKLSAYDILTFVVHGGTFLYVLVFLLKPFISVASYLPRLDSNFFLVPYFFFSYLTGHIIAMLSKRCIEKPILIKKHLWTYYLERKQNSLAKTLNDFSKNRYQLDFIIENKIDVDKSDKFFGRAVHFIEQHGKPEKIIVFQAQIGFFKNAIGTCAISGLLSFIASIVAYFRHLPTIPLVVSAITFIILGICSYLLYETRYKLYAITVYRQMESLIKTLDLKKQ